MYNQKNEKWGIILSSPKQKLSVLSHLCQIVYYTSCHTGKGLEQFPLSC